MILVLTERKTDPSYVAAIRAVFAPEPVTVFDNDPDAFTKFLSEQPWETVTALVIGMMMGHSDEFAPQKETDFATRTGQVLAKRIIQDWDNPAIVVLTSVSDTYLFRNMAELGVETIRSVDRDPLKASPRHLIRALFDAIDQRASTEH